MTTFMENARRDFARFTGAWYAVPVDARTRRAVLVAVIGLGLVATMMRSILIERTMPYSMGVIPDARPLALLVVALSVGAYAAAGPTQRRTHLLWFTVGVALLFQLEAATVHWFATHEGAITGHRVDVIALAGSAVAVAGVIALNADVAATDLATDHVARGGTRDDADAARRALAKAGLRRAFTLAGAVAGLGVLVVIAEALIGGMSVGGAVAALVVGVIIVGAGAAYGVTVVRGLWR